MREQPADLADPIVPSTPPTGPVADAASDPSSEVSEDRLRAGAEEALKRAGEDV